jgi:hypothetical protein
LQDPPKIIQIWIFGLKIYNLATLILTQDKVIRALHNLSLQHKIGWRSAENFLVAFWYIYWLFGTYFSRTGMLYQDKSGNPSAI